MDPQSNHPEDAAPDPRPPVPPPVEAFEQFGPLPGEIPLPFGEARRPPLEIQGALPGRFLPGVLLPVPIDVAGQFPGFGAAGSKLEELAENLAPLVRGERRVVLRQPERPAKQQNQAPRQRPHNGSSFPPGCAPGRR